MIKEGFTLPVRVYIEDTDAGGIVFHGQYINFMERARTEFMRGLGFGKTAIHHHNAMMVVHGVEIKYCQSAFLDDLLQVEVLLSDIKRASMTFRQNVYREKELLVQARVKIACINKESRRPVPIPVSIYDVIKEMKREVL